jgi:hypothetical protein
LERVQRGVQKFESGLSMKLTTPRKVSIRGEAQDPFAARFQNPSPKMDIGRSKLDGDLLSADEMVLEERCQFQYTRRSRGIGRENMRPKTTKPSIAPRAFTLV